VPITITFDTYKGKLGLTKIEYGEVRSYRGKESLLSEATFQWTKGVQCLVQLVLGSLNARGFSVADKALYDAMSRPQPWYRDLFGSSRVCKFVGGRTYLAHGGHTVVLYGRKLESFSEVAELWNQLFQDPFPAQGGSFDEDAPVRDDDPLSWLVKDIQDEIEFGLFKTLAFNPKLRDRELAGLLQNPLFKKLKRFGSTSLVSEVEKSLTLQERVLSKNYHLPRPVEIGVGPGGVAVQAIVREAQAKGVPISANIHFPHAQAILGDDSHGFEAFVADVSTLARSSTRSSHYHPLCVLPGTRNSLILPPSATGPKRLVTLESVSSSSFYLANLSDVEAYARQADELYDDIDVGCYTFWPFSSFFRELVAGREITNSNWSFDLGFLMVHESILRDAYLARSIVLALRDAWMSLRECSKLRAKRTQEVIDDSALRTSLLRASGYHAYLSAKSWH
jgi:hypothetical protein